MNEKDLINQLELDPKDLYRKMIQYRHYKKKGHEILSIPLIFTIPPENREAIFFILMGMRSIETGIDHLIGRNLA